MSVYRVEVAKSGRAACKGPKPCKGSKIDKDTLRLATMVTLGGHSSFAWRHWGCVTKKQLKNMKQQYKSMSEIDGYGDIGPEFQAKMNKAWEAEEVDPSDVPETAKKPESDSNDAESPKKDVKSDQDSIPQAKSTKKSTSKAKNTKTKKAENHDVKAEPSSPNADSSPPPTKRKRAKKEPKQQQDEE